MFRRPHDDLEANLYALSMADLIQRFLPPGVAHEALFDTTVLTLEHFEAGERPAPVFLRFFFMLLRDAGHEPRCDAGEIPGGFLAFDPAAGGIVDFRTHARAWRMRPETAMTLAHVARGEPPELCDPDAVDRAIRLLIAYARTIVNDDLTTLRLAIEPRPQKRRIREES
jgi:recombinational DNA repair protein (RecF pathway)